MALVLSLPRPSLIWAAITGTLFLILLWFLALRPSPEFILVGIWIESSFDVFKFYYFSYRHPLGRSILELMSHYYSVGGTADLVFLIVTLTLLLILCTRPISRPICLVSAFLLVFARVLDWAAMPRVRPYDTWAWLNPAHTPLRLLQSLLAGQRTTEEFWSDLGRVRPLEFIALGLTFGYLIATLATRAGQLPKSKWLYNPTRSGSRGNPAWASGCDAPGSAGE
jgi:hypothetical protein